MDQAQAPARERIGEIEFRLHEIAKTRRQLSKDIGDLDAEAARLKKELQALEAARAELRLGVEISDHALVRWLERHHGMDLEQYRREMVTPGLRDAVSAGAEGFKTAQGLFKMKGRVVTTFMTGKEGRS
jgi:septal ring factor EnvC (AmiA/AmiB activator)